MRDCFRQIQDQLGSCQYKLVIYSSLNLVRFVAVYVNGLF